MFRFSVIVCFFQSIKVTHKAQNVLFKSSIIWWRKKIVEVFLLNPNPKEISAVTPTCTEWPKTLVTLFKKWQLDSSPNLPQAAIGQWLHIYLLRICFDQILIITQVSSKRFQVSILNYWSHSDPGVFLLTLYLQVLNMFCLQSISCSSWLKAMEIRVDLNQNIFPNWRKTFIFPNVKKNIYIY